MVDADITQLLAELEQGNSDALSRIVSALYPELRQLAHARLRRYHETPTVLDTTSLVHESYLRFLKTGRIQVSDRAHFLAYAARVIRSVVVDFVRERSAQRRGGNITHIVLSGEITQGPYAADMEILQVHEALEDLAKVSERLVRVVEMRYFGGMSETEIGEALDITERTVRRDWEKARMLLAAGLKCDENRS